MGGENPVNVVLFVFAGRRANMELQLRWARRVLADNPTVRYHVWDLTRNRGDHRYVQSIEGERITVRSDFYGGNQWTGWDDVWRWYAARPEYRDTLFVKVDDDVVYFDHSCWRSFVDITDTFRGRIVSALTVNNGASTPLIPGIAAGLDDLGVPLLDVHESNAYADMAHGWFFNNSAELLGRDIVPRSSEDWLSINMIGMAWHTLCCVAQMVTTPSPRHIAGRDWPADFPLGDEGACNMLPRIIVDGVVAGHLTFGPQDVSDAQADVWRAGYAALLDGAGA